MKVIEEGGAAVNLTKKHFVAQGGEGSVYAIGDVGYKVYDDPKDAIPYGKIQELAAIDNDCVIKPLNPIKSPKGVHLGHTFRFVKDTHVLVSTFPKAFRNQHGYSNDQVLALVKKLQGGISSLHEAKILGVDLNEMNFLVSAGLDDIYFIDVDSYKTPSYPPTAIMASIRDWQTDPKDYHEGTDWFSFAILAFQMFVGIHPYKGKHPSLKGFEDRVMANMSVLHKDVRVPKACLPFDVIPKLYRGWFDAVLQNGERIAPPSGSAKAVAFVAPVRIIQDSRALQIKLILELPDSIHTASWSNGCLCALNGTTGVYKSRTGHDERISHALPAHTEIFWTPVSNKPLFAYIEDGNVQIRTHEGRKVDYVGAAESIKSSDGRLYCKFEDSVTEVQIHESRNRIFGSNHQVASVMPQASKLFEGAVIQSMLGKIFVNLFTGPQQSHQVRIAELDSVRTLDLKYQNRVLIAQVGENGAYHTLIFKFASDFSTYTLRKVDNVNPMGVNFSVLDQGIAVRITDEEKIEIFSHDPNKTGVKVLDDPNITGDMRLINNNSKLSFYRDRGVSSLTMGGKK